MRRLFVLAIFISAVLANGQTPYQTPVLLTTGGQSADGLFMKNVLTKEGIEFQYKPLATVADLDSAKTLIMVIGGSSKGLGAARISAEDEIARMTALLDSAAAKRIPVIAAHLGGKNRRGSLSDPFNDLGVQKSNHFFVVKGGDDDGYFKKRTNVRKIPYLMVDKTADLGAPLKLLFTKPAGE